MNAYSWHPSSRGRQAHRLEKLNSAMRQGEFEDALWKDAPGYTLDELWSQFIETIKEPASAATP